MNSNENETSSSVITFEAFLELVKANSTEKIQDMIRVNKEFLTMKRSSGDTAFTLEMGHRGVLHARWSLKVHRGGW